MKKLLIVYYSWSCGNTERTAKALQSVAGGDLVRLDTAVPYTGSYNDVVDQGQHEVNAGFEPELKALPVNVADYDVIAVGTPTWWYTMAPAVKAFLHGQNFAGKTVVPFMTNGGWPGRVIKDMKAACPGRGGRSRKRRRTFDERQGRVHHGLDLPHRRRRDRELLLRPAAPRKSMIFSLLSQKAGRAAGAFRWLCRFFYSNLLLAFCLDRLHTEEEVDEVSEPHNSENSAGNVERFSQHQEKADGHQQRHGHQDAGFGLRGHALFLHE